MKSWAIQWSRYRMIQIGEVDRKKGCGWCISVSKERGLCQTQLPGAVKMNHWSLNIPLPYQWLSVGSWSTQTSVSLGSSRSASTSNVSDSDSCSWWEQSNVIRCHWSGKISCELEIFDCNQTGGAVPSAISPVVWMDPSHPNIADPQPCTKTRTSPELVKMGAQSPLHSVPSHTKHCGLKSIWVWWSSQKFNTHLAIWANYNMFCQNQKSTACLEILGMIPILSIIYHLVMTNIAMENHHF